MMITYTISSTFKMMAPYYQQSFLVKKQAHLRFMTTLTMQNRSSIFQSISNRETGQATMITVGKLALVYLT